MLKKITTQLLCLLLIAASCRAQEKKVGGILPRAEISDVRRTSDEGLLFVCKIFASKSQVLYLNDVFRKPDPVGQAAPSGLKNAPPSPFSLNGSKLTDITTGTVYENTTALPTAPYFGPMEVLTSIPPGGWIQMAVAFPPLPPPPMKDGKPQPYKLLFEIPHLKARISIKLSSESLPSGQDEVIWKVITKTRRSRP